MATASKKKASKTASRKKTTIKKASEGRGRRTGKSIVVGSRGGKLPANWREELAKEAQEEAERTPAGSGNTIQLKKNGTFSFQGANLGESFNGVIVEHNFVNKWFDSVFDEQNPSPPACFALSMNGKDMVPHPDSPNKQSEDCDSCWANEWGSSERGRGKACGNRRRVAIIHEDDLRDIESAEIVLMEIPTTSSKTFSRYIGGITKAAGVPSYAVLTKFAMDPDADHQTVLVEMVETLPDDVIMAVRERRAEAKKMVMEAYDVSGYKPPKGGAAKRVGKKARGRGRGRDDDDAPRSRRKTANKKRSRFS